MTHSTDTTIREAITRAFSWAVSILVPRRSRRRPRRPRRPGRHSARYLSAVPPPTPPPVPEAPPPVPEATPRPAGRSPRVYAWSTPIPDHVRARHAPLRGEEVRLVRPYVLAAPTAPPPAVTWERRRAAALAALGVDYPYTYDGAPFPLSAFTTTFTTTSTATEATA
ncbi:hypothetical protein ACFC09_31420 [Streptomyces sp. NPDC056161]|uniref:hypothetical protein n=1 Tax=Streptomyces sp. NPDC056161 TaxID=3345732 RepID=UPI0035E0B0C3